MATAPSLAGRRLSRFRPGRRWSRRFGRAGRDLARPGAEHGTPPSRALAWSPLVSFSVSEELVRGRDFGPAVTGVTIAFNLEGTLDLAVRLQPSARRVVVVTGAADYDKYWIPRAAAVRSHPGLEASR